MLSSQKNRERNKRAFPSDSAKLQRFDSIRQIACQELRVSYSRRHVASTEGEVRTNADRSRLTTDRGIVAAKDAMKNPELLPETWEIELPVKIAPQLRDSAAYPFPGQSRANGRPL